MNVNEALHRLGLIEREAARRIPSLAFADGKVPELTDDELRAFEAVDGHDDLSYLSKEDLEQVVEQLRGVVERMPDVPLGVLARHEPSFQNGQPKEVNDA